MRADRGKPAVDPIRYAIRDGRMISAAKRRSRASRPPLMEGNSLQCEAQPGGNFICGSRKGSE